MTVRELLVAVAKSVEGNELANAINTKTEESDEIFKDKTQRLLSCFNIVLTDVAINYLPPTDSKVLTEKTTKLSDISSRIIRVLGVYDEGKNAVEYKVDGDYITVKKSGYSVVFEYIPLDCDIDDEFYYTDKIISSRAFIYGISAEYCLLEMRYDECANWDGKYRQAIEVKTDFKKRRLKARRGWGL